MKKPYATRFRFAMGCNPTLNDVRLCSQTTDPVKDMFSNAGANSGAQQPENTAFGTQRQSLVENQMELQLITATWEALLLNLRCRTLRRQFRLASDNTRIVSLSGE
jgi:hypothetical protein